MSPGAVVVSDDCPAWRGSGSFWEGGASVRAPPPQGGPQRSRCCPFARHPRAPCYAACAWSVASGCRGWKASRTEPQPKPGPMARMSGSKTRATETHCGRGTPVSGPACRRAHMRPAGSEQGSGQKRPARTPISAPEPPQPAVGGLSQPLGLAHSGPPSLPSGAPRVLLHTPTQAQIGMGAGEARQVPPEVSGRHRNRPRTR